MKLVAILVLAFMLYCLHQVQTSWHARDVNNRAIWLFVIIFTSGWALVELIF